MSQDTTVAAGAPQDEGADKVIPPATEPVEPDLEKERDDRVVPVVRGMLIDLAAQMVPEDANKEVNYLPVILALLKRALDADLNIIMDNPYAFQIIKGVLVGLNVTVQQLKPSTDIDDVRFGRIAKQILGMVAVADIGLTPKTPEEVEASFAPVKEQLQALFDAEKLSWIEIKYIMDNIFASFDNVSGLFNRKVETALEKAEAKAMGVEYMSDLTMGKLDVFLKSEPAPAAEVKA